MTTELEEQFFKVFGIEKIECCKHFKYFDSKCDRLDLTEKCLDCIGTNKVYPKITDRVLLKLIIIAINYGNRYRWIYDTSNIEELKSETLELLIKLDVLLPHIKHQIQQLFKEEVK